MRTRAIFVSVLAVLALSACATGSPGAGPTADGPSADPTPDPTPTATISFAPPSVPTDCATLVDESTYAATFGATPLNDPAVGEPGMLGVVTPTAPAEGASPADAVDAATQLRCIWRDPGADITYLRVQIGSVGGTIGTGYRTALELDGYTCDQSLGGDRCAITGTDPQYQTETGDTVFERDDIVVRIDQANFPTDNLLGAIVSRIWAD